MEAQKVLSYDDLYEMCKNMAIKIKQLQHKNKKLTNKINNFYKDTLSYIDIINNAIKYDCYNYFRKLINLEQININLKDVDNNNLLHMSVKYPQSWRIVNLFINSGVNINERNNKNETPLLIAINNNNYNIANILLKNGADIDDECIFKIINRSGRGAFYVLRNMIKRGIDIDIVNNNGLSLLHLSTKNNNYGFAKYLIMKGIDKNIKDCKNKTAFDYACLNHYIKLIELLNDN